MYQIFIVEDHHVMQHMYQKYIERIQDIEICAVAQNGDEALSMLPFIAPDLMLLDISLPGQSGISVLKYVKKCLPHLPVLVISGHDQNVYARTVLQLGADGYMDKLGLGRYFEPAIRSIMRGESVHQRKTRQ